MKSKEIIEDLLKCVEVKPEKIKELSGLLWEVEKSFEENEKWKKAMGDIIRYKPVEPYKANYSSIGEFVNQLKDYILKLSDTDNIIISAVYEKFKTELDYKLERDLKEDLEVLDLLKKLILSGEIKVCEDMLLDYPEIAGWLEDE